MSSFTPGEINSSGAIDSTITDFWVDTVEGQSPITVWDYLSMGGQVWPGLWRLEVEKAVKLEVARPSATVPNKILQPTITDKGYEPATIKATGQIWTEDDWIMLQQVLPIVAPQSYNSVRPALDISHPATYLLDISSVIVVKVKMHPPVDQILVVELDLLEWFPSTAVPAGAKALYGNGAKAKAGDFSTTGPTVNDPANTWVNRQP